MAFLEIKEAGDIFDAINNDSVLAPLLGTLSFPDGDQPSLVVAVGGNALDGVEEMSGLIVVIERDAAVRSRRLITAQSVITKEFKVRLVQIEDAARNLEAAVDRIAEIFPGCSVTNIGNPDGLAGDGQAVVTLPPNCVALV